ncbi:acyl carrier protein [Vibrio mangrovi]|uniref:Alpha/beta fold hydrolase n=1 Tax=Vibrio mangrovi TaxID=474394 RepID=A0A1Y6IPX9_9VIBR|nr:acyl carrier protein [Vibrio mangrovi]MDW6003510.1 alpha/beta fold hydrolase [Vibrio mangrovi]SMR99696.1 Plipastatin synthase subunit E [Vibrio mangrovi]
MCKGVEQSNENLNIEISRIKSVFEEVLDQQDIDIDTNFFDLGGDSFDAIRVISKLNGKQLPIVTLFENPTVRTFAQFILGNDSTLQARIVCLSDNSRTEKIAFVGVPYGGGDPTNYKHLFLDNNSVSVYGLDFGDSHVENVNDCEELVRELADKINELQAEKIIIYGHCAGAALASCLAAQLNTMRKNVILIAAAANPVLDPDEKLSEAERTSESEWGSYLRFLGGFEGLSEKESEAMLARGRRDHILSCESYRLLRQLDTSDLPAMVILGGKDPATSDMAACFDVWKTLLDVKDCQIIDDGGHYFLRTHSDELTSMVLRFFH